MSEEQTLFRGSPSLVLKLGTFVLCGLIALACLILPFVFPVLFPWLLILAAAPLLYAAIQWLLIKCRVYEITTERIRLTTGILTKRTDELELYRVKDVTLIEPFFLRLFSLGNIVITTNDASTPTLALDAVRGARDLREKMRLAIEACRDRKRVRLTELE